MVILSGEKYTIPYILFHFNFDHYDPTSKKSNFYDVHYKETQKERDYEISLRAYKQKFMNIDFDFGFLIFILVFFLLCHTALHT
jgi:hypothetical protein